MPIYISICMTVHIEDFNLPPVVTVQNSLRAKDSLLKDVHLYNIYVDRICT